MNWNRFLNPAGYAPSYDASTARVGTVADPQFTDPPIDKAKEGTTTDFMVLVAALVAGGTIAVLIANDLTSPDPYKQSE